MGMIFSVKQVRLAHVLTDLEVRLLHGGRLAQIRIKRRVDLRCENKKGEIQTYNRKRRKKVRFILIIENEKR